MNSTVPAARSPAPGDVLLVDDNADVLDSIAMVLEDLGLRVTSSSSGRQAVERVRSGAHFDLVLCDVGMPQMNGWQVAEALRELAPDLKIFLLTGAADQIDAGDPRRALVTGVLPKPIELDTLERLLVEQLGGAS